MSDNNTQSTQPSKLNGNLNSVLGAAKETIGDAIGVQSLSDTGAKQRAEGNREYEAAKAQVYLDNAGTAAKTKVEGVVSNLVNDPEAKAEADVKHNIAKSKMDANAPQ
ncbi:hypothetical protein BZG36_01655 [Bifiguratus adelaidae]|uniref:CsbD-like domain-containing protein n=1 Tax=Bifiguratus adelaidae TaxID=1938954 RepID=A0A261Y469_9FUNG|nr:hypothetical protein BZG36_01655 [Bifiguratus adelaidae]